MTTPAADPRGEELRLALVLNGGVSLAVWMGGVSYELNRLVRETHPVYEGLLRLTSTKARIDVISGTSAGGINGAALALAQVHDTSLYGLREVWLASGGLDQLMREPDEEDPPSLLRGDEHFLPQIEQALASIATGAPIAKDGAPMLLSLTTTLLRGIGKTQLDDFGGVIEDTVHRAHFVFERREGSNFDAFARGSRIVQQLAHAARASASFPVAFEPALYAPGSPPFKGKTPLVEQGGTADPVKTDTYLLDGGILDNRPFDAALEAISKLPADGNTRRVMAYIAPDPSAAVTPRPPGPDGLPPPPTLAEVALQSAIGIPGTQSIADQLAALREHGNEMRRRWQRISGLLQHTPRDELLQTAALLFPAYRARRLDGAIDYLLDELVRGLTAPGANPDERLRRSTRLWLRGLWLDTCDDKALWGDVIPDRFTPFAPAVPEVGPPERSLADAPEAAWQWGQYALEFMASVVIDMLRRTQRLMDLIGRWQEKERAGAAAPEADGPPLLAALTPALQHGKTWEQLDRESSVLGRRAAQKARGFESAGGELHDIWRSAYAINLKLRERRRLGDAQIQSDGRKGFSELLAAWRERSGAPVGEAKALIRRLRPTPTAERLQQRQSHANELCAALAGLRQPIEDILAAMPARPGALSADGQPQPDTRADVAEALKELRAYHDYFFDAGRPTSADTLARRLLALDVIEVAAGTREHRTDAGAELVQISARLVSPWGGPATPQGKLTGMGLAHFAAFYKRSWRANDWLYGRLDGIDRAVRIALNPDRLQRLYGERHVRPAAGEAPIAASAYVQRYLHNLAVLGAAPELQAELATAWNQGLPGLVRELAWLDQSAMVPPPVLRHCAEALTRRLHLEVLMQELPDLALAIDQDDAIGATASSQGKRLRVGIEAMKRDPAKATDLALQLLRSGLLGADTLRGEVGSDHFTRTVSRGIAVAQVTAASGRSGLKSLSLLLKLTEWPIWVFYWLANRLTQGSRTSAALEAAAIGIGAALVTASLLAEKLPSVLTVTGWSLLAGALAATLVRSWRVGIGAVAVALALLASLDVPTALFVGAVAIMVGFSAWLVMPLALLVVAWWSAGRPDLAALRALPCIDALAWAGACPKTPAPEGKVLAAATRLFEVGVPALLVVLLVLCICVPRMLPWFVRQGRALAQRVGRRA